MRKHLLFACLIVTVLLTPSAILKGQTLERQTLAPESPSVAETLAPQLSAQQAEALQQRIQDLRHAALSTQVSAETDGLPVVLGREMSAVENSADTETHPLPTSSFIFGRNNLNTRGSVAGNSTLAEPAGANDGVRVFASGNFGHQEYSLDGGVTWTNVPLPAGPANATTPCCGDSDVIFDKSRGLTVALQLYLEPVNTKESVIRLFVRRTVAGVGGPPGLANCTYIIDTPGAVLMDFPKINVSNDFLYLATNELLFTSPSGAFVSTTARMRRITIDPLYDCGAVTINTFSWAASIEGQKVWRPVEGAREKMYWAHHAAAGTLRIFSWDEAAGAPVNVVRAVAGSTFAGAGTGPDCRGGVQAPQRDWFGGTAAAMAGFGKTGAVGQGRLAWYWNVMADASHTQGHVHSAIFAEGSAPPGTIVLIASTPLFNNGFCIGFPNVSMNERGDIGFAMALGGKAGGAGVGFPAASAASPAYGIDDDFTAGIGFPGSLFASVAGTHNRCPSGSPPDDRYGDYFGIHPHSPEGLFFFATGYALVGSGNVCPNSPSNPAFVRSRVVEFGRNRDAKGYFGWRGYTRVP